MHTRSLFALVPLGICSAFAAPLTNVPPPFSTNVPGIYHLDRAWVGESRAVVLTGWFAEKTNSPEVEKLEKDLRFDLFTVRDKFSADQTGLIVARRPGLLVISASRGRTMNGWFQTMLHVYQPALPSNAEIEACATDPKLRELFGAPHIADAAPYFASWSFFTFTPTNTIETLSVSCIAKEWDGPIDGLTIRRGVAKQSE